MSQPTNHSTKEEVLALGIRREKESLQELAQDLETGRLTPQDILERIKLVERRLKELRQKA